MNRTQTKDRMCIEVCRRVEDENISIRKACMDKGVSPITYHKWKTKRSFINDTKGVSYPLFTIILTLIIGTACYIVLLPAVNIVSTAMNVFIADGSLSVQTVDAYTFNLNLYKIMPLFLIFGLFLYAITQALLRKGTEG